MIIAHDEFGNRIIPQKNKIGFCPICSEKVIPICGLINVHHWRHDNETNCDPWKEHETEWHLRWKMEFPADWQEVVIKRFGEIHRADIMTNSGLVLELQNSSILASTIIERERFYQNMVWLINAASFKDNFKIYSLVTSKLKYNEDFYDSYHSVDNSTLIRLEKDKESLEKEILAIKSHIKYKENEIDNYLEKVENIDSVVESLLKGTCYGLYDFKSNNELINIYKDLQLAQNKIKDEVLDLIKQRDYLYSFKKCTITDFSDYSFVPFKLVKPSNYDMCKVIESSTLHM